MLTMITEEPDGRQTQNNTGGSVSSFVHSSGDNMTFPRMMRRSRCPRALLGKVDWNELMAKATEEDKKCETTHPSEFSDSDDSENIENNPPGPIDLTGPSQNANDLVLDLSAVKCEGSKSTKKSYTMPTAGLPSTHSRHQIFRNTPLKEFNNALKTPLGSRFAPILESPHEVVAKKSLFASEKFVYEREIVTHKHMAMTPNSRKDMGVHPIEYQEVAKVAERFETVRDGNSNTSGYYSQVSAAPPRVPQPMHSIAPIYDPPRMMEADPQPPPPSTVFAVPEPPAKPKSSSKEIVVNGRSYQILALLGKGGSSKVYLVLAKDNSLLAIKCVNLGNVDEKIRRDHLNEIEHLIKMQHCKHIIQIIDHQYVPSKNLLFAVMQRGDTDLSRILKERTTSGEGVPPEMILFYWSEILLAVKSIHDNNIIHRDLKPANFLLVGGRLKLIDFGIASGIESEQTSVFKDSQSGTPNYMSPEAWEDLGVGDQRLVKIGRKTDVWALGCILYAFLYGKTPFQEYNNPMAKFRAITNPNHNIPFPPVKGVPEMLIESCRRCLIYDKNKRASIEELLDLKTQILMTPLEVVGKLRDVLDADSLEKAKSAIISE